MRGTSRPRVAVTFLTLLVLFAVAAGCRTTTRSGLPDHIRTVEVYIFQNKTMYKGLESTITRNIIDRINADPTIRVVSGNGDALITGEITNVNRYTLRETTTNEPGTVRIVLYVEFSFYDQINRRYIIEDQRINSQVTGEMAGIYEASHGGDSYTGEQNAARAVAGEIVRRTVGMW